MGPPPSDDGASRTYHRARRTRKPALLLAIATAALLVGWRRWRPYRIEVEGGSMAPLLQAGDWALAIRARGIRRGDVVVIEHPRRPGFELVKRVVAGPGGRAPDGSSLAADGIWVQGDASERSTDSRAFGALGIDAVRGRVILVWWPPARWGPVSRS